MSGQRTGEDGATDIWRKYEAGRDHHNGEGMYRRVERCHRFYQGDQWHGIKSGGEELPVLNFIRPICTYKIATVAMNDTAVIYSAMDGDAQAAAVCEMLTRFAAVQWEKGKMDSKKWAVIKNACIAGDHYLYCYDAREPSESVAHDRTPRLRMRLVGKTSLYLADEQEPDINSQEWIIIAERRPVAQVREEARRNGVAETEIARIAADEVDETGVGYTGAQEVKTDLGKCTSLLYMEKTPEGMKFCRSAQTVIYQPEQMVPGLDVYPVCGMRWSEKMGSARGVGVVEGLIPNQIEVNRTLARRAVCVKRYSFPTAVYDQDKVANPEALGKVGASLRVKNLAGNPLSSMVQYLTPMGIGGDAAALQGELVVMSRELEGASDAATGQVDPTRASGEAIKAARDQSAMNLNEQTAAYKQFVEDLALIWYKLWAAYSADGMAVRLPDGQGGREEIVIPQRALTGMEVDIRIDVSPADPYSVLSREMALENALARGHITFEEYVEALDENSGVPKDKFRAILERRQAFFQQQAAGAEAGMTPPGAAGQTPGRAAGMPPGAGLLTGAPGQLAGEGLFGAGAGLAQGLAGRGGE